jgi:ATP-dependent Clp protease adapter protein ClpS
MADNQEQQVNDEQSKSGTAVATKPATRPAPPRVDSLPPWRVLLHNDDHNDMADVVLAIRMVTRMTAKEAFSRMLEAHDRGLCLLLETHRERAELLVEQFATFNLVVTAEPADR